MKVIREMPILMTNHDSDPILRNVRIGGRRTSIKLEASMWEALHEICERTGKSVDELCTEVHGQPGSSNFTSRLRVFILSYFRRPRPDNTDSG